MESSCNRNLQLQSRLTLLTPAVLIIITLPIHMRSSNIQLSAVHPPHTTTTHAFLTLTLSSPLSPLSPLSLLPPSSPNAHFLSPSHPCNSFQPPTFLYTSPSLFLCRSVYACNPRVPTSLPVHLPIGRDQTYPQRLVTILSSTSYTKPCPRDILLRLVRTLKVAGSASYAPSVTRHLDTPPPHISRHYCRLITFPPSLQILDLVSFTLLHLAPPLSLYRSPPSLFISPLLSLPPLLPPHSLHHLLSPPLDGRLTRCPIQPPHPPLPTLQPQNWQAHTPRLHPALSSTRSR